MGGISRTGEISTVEKRPSQEVNTIHQNDACILDYLSRDMSPSAHSFQTTAEDITSNSINFEDDFDDCETTPLEEKIRRMINESIARLREEVKEQIKDDCGKVQAQTVADFTALKTTADREDYQRLSQVIGAVGAAVMAVTKAYEDVVMLRSGLQEATVRGQKLQHAMEDVRTRLEQHATVQTNSLRNMASQAEAVRDLTMTLNQTSYSARAAHIDLSKLRVKYREMLENCRSDAKEQQGTINKIKRCFESLIKAENQRASVPEQTDFQCESPRVESPYMLKHRVIELENKLQQLEISEEQLKEDQETWETTQQVYQRGVEFRLGVLSAKHDESAQAVEQSNEEIQRIKALQHDERFMTPVDASRRLGRLEDEFRQFKRCVERQDPYEPVLVVLLALAIMFVTGVTFYHAIT